MRPFVVSEELNSVETSSLTGMGDDCPKFQKNLIVWKRCVLWGLNSIITLVSEELNSVETTQCDVR